MTDHREKLLGEMAGYFKTDERRISHARQVTEYAEELWRREGGDYPIIIGAAVLHDIGIHEAERKYRSSAGKYQEIEGPPIARPILIRLGFTPEQIEEICDIIGHHHRPGKITSLNFRVLYDADRLVNLKDDYDVHDRGKLAQIIGRVFLTESGKSLAQATCLP